MRDELLGYYERELVFLRQMGAEFARKYPKIAGRLQLEADKCEDPHVERMIEAFAFLAARVQLKIADEFPEITESLLNVLYPHYLAPIPSMSIVKFELDPEQGKITTGYPVERETVLYSRPYQGTPCRFRTSYPVVVWPIEVENAALESLDPVDTRGRWSEAVIRISLRCMNGTKLSNLKVGQKGKEEPIDKLRFYINGEPQLVYPLYEMIFNNVVEVELRPLIKRTETTRLSRLPQVKKLPPGVIKTVGFELDEAMLPYTARSFPGYRLLTEYFACPEKFLFFDIQGLNEAAKEGFGDRFEIVIKLRDVQQPRAVVSANTFQLGCTPVINLFQKIAEPINLTQQKNEYRVIADVHRQQATEVYSVDEVFTLNPQHQKIKSFQPFYSYQHARSDEQEKAFWYATRRTSQVADDEGTEVYLTLVDLGFNPHVPPVEVVTLETTCTNRDLPSKLPFGGREGDFEVETPGPLSRGRCLKKPTETLRPPLRRSTHWRLISHLSLNHISLVEGPANGLTTTPLQEVLMLYDFLNTSSTRKQIQGIANLSSRRVVRQIGERIGTGFVRGLETTIEFDEEKFVGAGVFLFASVLDRFLALYASVNSFNQLVARKTDQEGILKRWPPRAGEQIIL
ncbi:MAG: type VI secretion system baseplate subunit TssF [Acidobacteriota bacterium]